MDKKELKLTVKDIMPHYRHLPTADIETRHLLTRRNLLYKADLVTVTGSDGKVKTLKRCHG